MRESIVQRLREAAATLPSERVSVHALGLSEARLAKVGLAIGVTAGVMPMAWAWGSEWLLGWLSI